LAEADWLEEQGEQTALAEPIRVQIERPRRDPVDS
jgi:uncharacterized protein (TIGR02996 family)